MTSLFRKMTLFFCLFGLFFDRVTSTTNQKFGYFVRSTSNFQGLFVSKLNLKSRKLEEKVLSLPYSGSFKKKKKINSDAYLPAQK